ncbi:MAG: NAD(P)H-hydrate epimerase, partial [Emcibacteraceae bacterium]|nr:NAD(P)H-hydrate epimerase [Emcibacteraceae bacterium]
MRENCNSILTAEKMTQVDKIAIAELSKVGRSGVELMEEAGQSVVREITGLVDGRTALILCGPGNNGGDGFVIARHLKGAGWEIQVALLGSIQKLNGDAKVMAEKWDGEVVALTCDLINDQDIIVDAIFGTGLSKEITGELADVINAVNRSKVLKIAVDIPSGIKGDTGEVLGVALNADKTVTFCRKKPAHLLYPGKIHCGDVILTDIGISDRVVNQVSPDIFENTPRLWRNVFPTLVENGHKYHRGHAVVVSGGIINTGASRLAAMAALRIGAGLVSVSSPDDALAVHAAHLTAIMIKKRSELAQDLKDDR